MWYYFCVNDDGCRILFSGVSGIMVNIKDIEEKTRKCYQKAKDELALFEKRSSVFAHSALSDVIPNYKSELLEFGAYIEDNFAVLFVDMRNSTKRCEIIGAEKTFFIYARLHSGIIISG